MANNIEISVDLEIKKATQKINQLEKEVKEMSGELKKANADGLNNSLKKVNTTAGSVLPTLTKLAGTIGVGMVATTAIKSMAEFEASISKLGAISQTSGVQLEELRNKALELGAKTQYSASQVAEGMNYLAMAGFKTNDILKATGDVLNLATIGQIDLGRASDISSNILSGFGLKAGELKRVVDDMSATITNSNTDISQMGEAMKYVAPVAKTMGVSVEDTATAIGILGNAGIQGSMAGTSLTQMLTAMASPTGQAKQMIEQLNIKLFDSKGKFIGLKQALQQFADKTKNLSKQDQLTAYKTIFGQEAMKSAITLTSEVDKSYDKLNEKIKKSAGLSNEVSKQMQDNLQGDWKKLLSALDGVAQSIGKDLLPALRDLTQDLTAGVTATQNFYKEHRALIKTLAELGATLLIVNKAFKMYELFFAGGALMRMGTMITSIATLSKEFKVLKIAMMGLEAVNPVLLAIGVTVGILMYKINAMEEEVKKLHDTTNKLKSSTNEMKSLNDEIKKLGNNTATKKNLEDLKQKTTELIKKNKERLEQIKKMDDGSQQYKETISQLEKRQALLNAVLKKTNEKLKTKDYLTKKNIESSKNAKQSIKILTDEQQKYLDNLDKEVAKTKQKTETTIESYQAELSHLDKMLKGTKEYQKAKAELSQIYTAKIKQEYQKRVTDHTNTLNQLKDKEKSLANKIVEINKQLANKLKSIENSRISEVTSIEDKIHNIQTSGLSSYQQYNDKKLQADKKLQLAKEQLQAGNLTLAKQYMGQYRSIVESLANTEIKDGKRVLVSKKQSNAVAISGLKKLEGVTNDYYAKQKAKAVQLHNEKLSQLKTQLIATREQIKLQVQRLNLEKQMIEMMTGKKVNIDTTSALNSIKNLDEKIKGIDNEIKKSKKVNLGADTKEVDKTLNDVKNKKANIKVGADTKEAQNVIIQVKDKITGKTQKLKVGADTHKADSIIVKVKDSITNSEQVLKVNANANKALATINKLKQPTHSTHTVYIREVHKKATGGLIPIRRATGGDIDFNEFKRQNGRIAGYDPTDSDSVPAMLTAGEFVVKRDAVAHYGDNLLWALNNKALSKDMLPKFYTGGMVTQGTPQKLITELSNGTNGNGENGGKSLDISELIKKLEELVVSFKGQNVPIVNEIKSELTKLKSNNSKFQNDSKGYNEFKSSTKGKTLSKSEYANYKNQLNNKNKALKKDNEIANRLKEEVNKIVQKVKIYLAQVEAVKKEIKAKLTDLTAGADIDIKIPATIENEIESSLDLNRLKNYKNQLGNKSFKFYVNKVKEELETRYRLVKPTDFEVKAHYMSLAPTYDPNYTAKSSGAREIYRQLHDHYGVEYKAKEEFLKNIAHFQNGGLMQLQNGGKLAGYGGGDRNLALLEDGEFVIRKEAVSSFGADMFHNLNNLKLPKFQTGGLIGNIPSSSNSTPSDLVNVNFNLPSGKGYQMQSNESVAKALASELKRMM